MAVHPVVAVLALTVFLQWAGGNVIVPLLPLFVTSHGGSDFTVGAVAASFFAAGFSTQYLLGRLSDRLGRLPVIIGGLAVFSASTLGFLAPVGPAGYMVLRALQGVGSGAAEVAALAAVGAVAAPEERGRAFAAIYGAQLAGLAVGPVLGSLAGEAAMPYLFVASATMALVACIPVTFGLRDALGRAKGRPGGTDRPGKPAPSWAKQTMAGVLMAGVAGGVLTGTYESCWTLLLHMRGALSWQIGLSWTAFALPFAVFALPAGWLADHMDRRRLVSLALASSAGFAALYPWLRQVSLLVGLGALESVGVAVAYPAVQSLLATSVSAGHHGRAQGTLSSVQTASTALAALLGGGLFALAAWLPFSIAAGVTVTVSGAVWAVWRGVDGHHDRD